MSSKRVLIKKLLNYPNINNDDYLLLIHKKNKILEKAEMDEINELTKINEQIDLYTEKQLLINMIKYPYHN
jgi:hypothetical protein